MRVERFAFSRREAPSHVVDQRVELPAWLELPDDRLG